MSDRADLALPAVHLAELARLVARWGIEAEELFRGTAVEVAALSDPRARVTAATLVDVVRRARSLTGEPALGFLFGKQMRASAHGYLGFAAMTSATVRDALEVAVRFAPTRTSLFALRFHVDERACALVIDEQADLGDARDLVLAALLVGIAQIGGALTGRELDGSLDFACARPAALRHLGDLEGRVRFAQPLNQIVFAREVLDLPLVMADEAARKLAEEQLEHELDAIGRRSSLPARVRALLPRGDGGFRSLADVAAALGVSPRTLKRRLAEHATDFTTLLEEQQRERAILLLRAEDLSLEEVAERLDYSDVANFSRAFRRWTGTTPAAFRRGGTKG